MPIASTVSIDDCVEVEKAAVALIDSATKYATGPSVAPVAHNVHAARISSIPPTRAPDSSGARRAFTRSILDASVSITLVPHSGQRPCARKPSRLY